VEKLLKGVLEGVILLPKEGSLSLFKDVKNKFFMAEYYT